ncbi:LOW QUALITY PROTEIN: X-ray radiation resistance-associated protein 1 [Amazona ochrocephala]
MQPIDLDLSYNNLSRQDKELGDLSQLKVLRLTANGLRSLPLDLDSPQLKFPSLEVLSLDDNRLSDPSVFVSLSHLRRLKELNLDRNRISAVPYLRQAESRHFLLHPELDHSSFRAQWYRSLSSLWRQSRPSQQESMEVPEELEAKKGQIECVMLQNEGEVSKSGSQEHPAQVVPKEGEPSASKPLLAPSTRRSTPAPFPELRSLNKSPLSLLFSIGGTWEGWDEAPQLLAWLSAKSKPPYLQIADEAALLPVAFFPSLKELTFHNNPLSSTRSGQPPLLTWLLQHNLGIKLVRQKSPATERWHLSIPLKASRKVRSHLPKVTKRPRVLEAPAKTFLRPQLPSAVEAVSDAPAPAQPLLPSSSMIPTSSQRMVLGEEEGGSRSPGSDEGHIASFFTTQLKDVSRPGAGARLEKRSEKREEGRSQGVPEQYKGYEELLSGDTDPDLTEPVGICKKAQALYQVLDHPLVYQDAKAQLDCVQKPHVPREKVKSWSSKGRLLVSGSGSIHVCGWMLRPALSQGMQRKQPPRWVCGVGGNPLTSPVQQQGPTLVWRWGRRRRWRGDAAASWSSLQHARMPGAPAWKTKAEILEGILLAMSSTQTFTEVPLATVLQRRKSKPREYRKARRLMEEFQEVLVMSLLVQEMAKPSDEAQMCQTPKPAAPEQAEGLGQAMKDAHSPPPAHLHGNHIVLFHLLVPSSTTSASQRQASPIGDRQQ